MNGARVVGVDVARCVALVGMMAVHILPGVVAGEVTAVQQLAGGRASALFAVLAGVSLVLMAGRRTPLRGRAWWAYFAGVLVRSLWIGTAGLLLGELETGIAVILAYYAVLFVLAAPFLALPTRPLVVLTGLWVVVAPVLSHVLRAELPPTSYAVPSLDSLEQPADLARELLLTGYYPVLTWLGYALVGILVGRMDLRSTRTALVLVAGGLLAMANAWAWSTVLLDRPGVRGALVRTFSGAGRLDDFDATLTHGLYGTTPTGSWWWLAVRGPHTGTTFDLLMTAGSACLVLGVALLVGRALPRLTGVLFGAGAMTLTLYTLHVLARTEGYWDGDDRATFVGQVVTVLAIGAVFRLAGRRGPLEAVVGVLSDAARRAVAGRR